MSSTLASLLTFNIDDVKDFASRQTAYTKTVILPGSQRNNKLFGSIFEVAISNPYDPATSNIEVNFNPSVSADCILFQDFLQTFKGTLRILQINVDRGNIEYEAAITGVLAKLNVALSSGLLEDLDFSAYDETYNETNIIASWDNPGGSGVYYPLIDYGTYSVNKNDWDYKTFRPALYVKEYIDKMFEAAGFRYQSNIFDSARFKSLIIPHNQKVLTKLASQLFLGDVTATQTVMQNIGPTNGMIDFDTFSGTAFTSLHSPVNTEFQYTLPDVVTTTVNINLTGHWKAFSTSIQLSVMKNGAKTIFLTLPAIGGTTLQPFTYTGQVVLTLAQNDIFSLYAEAANLSGSIFQLDINTAHVTLDAAGTIPVPVILGDTIAMNDTIPKNIRQVDFLVSIIKLFNLYVYEDKFDERLLYIEPFIDFYSEDSTNAVDWTYKLDRKNPVNIKPMSEINSKVYNFKYADDNDYYNELYRKRYNISYGSYIFDTQFEFVSQTTDVELIFASTPLVGYAGEEKVYPTIFKLSDNKEETLDSVIRIMQTKKITGVSSWTIKNGVFNLISITDYGYAGHFDDPDNVTNDLNFGAPEELFFILVSGDLTVTQFNLYWSSYMAEITDKDSKMLTGKFYLTPADILNLDFSIYVNVDGNLFRLNKITDYNLIKPDLCTCELLRVLNTLY
jgi:hypothetical protein